MKRINKPNKDGIFTINFDGSLLAKLEIKNGNIIVINAMNGYGNSINIED